MENWSIFEELAKTVQAELSPKACVTRNEVVRGKSSATNQCDITIRSTIGQINFFAIIECKDYAKNVGVPIVREFASKINDTGAMKGIIVAAKGFTNVAREFAKYNNIDTYTLFDAQSIKWNEYAFVPVSIIHVTLKSAELHFKEILQASEPANTVEMEVEVTADAEIIDKTNSRKLSIRKYIENIWDNAFRFDATLAESRVRQEFDSEANRWKVHFQSGKEINVIIHASIECYYTYYYGHIKLAQGRGFKDLASKKMLAKNFLSEQLDFKEILAKWPSVDESSKIPFTPSLWIRIIQHFRSVKGPHLPEKMKIGMENGQFVLDNIYDSGHQLRWRISKSNDG